MEIHAPVDERTATSPAGPMTRPSAEVRGGIGEPMNHADLTFFNAHTETTSQAIAAFCLLDGVPDMDRLRRRVAETLGRSFRRFTQLAVRDGGPRWVPAPNFDVNDHVSLLRSPEVVDLTSLLAVASREFTRPLHFNRPLWRMTVITGEPGSDGRPPVTALLFLLHHATADGLGALEALYAFCEEPLVRTARETDDPDDVADDWGSARGPLARLAVGARCVRRIVYETIKPPISSPLNGPNSTGRQASLFRFPRSELRRIGVRLDGSLHDVLMCLLAGALARYHARTGHPLGDMRAIVPVSIRRSAQREDMGNLITAVGIGMPIGLPTPRERLHAIRRELEQLKSDGSVAAYRFLSWALSRLPSALHRIGFERMFRNTNFLCTIIPGARHTKTLAGARIDLIAGFAANNRNHGSSFTFVTYRHEVSLVVLVDPAVVSDLPGLEACVRESYDELRGIGNGA
ncbi:MAG TPA: WS/DGAT domain-containing protein [Vicinamibacterales bacterium]